MKVLAVVFLALVGLAASITPEQKQLLQETHTQCRQQTNADPAEIKQTRQGVFGTTPSLAEYFLCFLKRTKVLNDQGEFQRDHLDRILTTGNGRTIADQILNNCLVVKSTQQETALEYLRCAHKYRPTPAVQV